MIHILRKTRLIVLKQLYVINGEGFAHRDRERVVMTWCLLVMLSIIGDIARDVIISIPEIFGGQLKKIGIVTWWRNEGTMTEMYEVVTLAIACRNCVY